MNIRQHIIPVTVKKVLDTECPVVVNMLQNYTPPSCYKVAQVPNKIDVANMNINIPVYSEAVDYIVCQIRSTMQHEAEHKLQEQKYHETSIEERQPFKDFSDPSKVEPEAERAEETCIAPKIINGTTENVNVKELWEKAKSQANMNPAWKTFLTPMILPAGILGVYLQHSMTEEEAKQFNATQSGENQQYEGKIPIDIDKIIQPWVVKQQFALPATTQTKGDGAVTQDPDTVVPGDGQTGAVPSAGTVPSVGTVPTI